MPFSEIKYCIICVGIKPETKGKLGIAGFLGLSPEVYVDIDFPPGLVELSFLMEAGPGDGGKYRLAFRVVDNEGSSLHEEAEQEFVAQPQPKAYVIFEAVRVRYPAPGEYRMQLIVDGAVHYEASFELYASVTSGGATRPPEVPQGQSGPPGNIPTSIAGGRKGLLQTSIDALFQAANGTIASSVHWLPDVALMQVGFDVYEQAIATLMVSGGGSPRAAVANARAALEASIDMLVLVSEPSLYDERGAFMRVCELLLNEDNRKYAERAALAQGSTIPNVADMSPDEAVTRDAEQWEVHQPGITVTYKRVLAQARQKQRWKYHWSGLGNFAALAEHIEKKNAAPGGFKEMATAWFRILSHAVHPSPRTGRRSLDYTTGRPLLGPKENDDALPLAAARWACDHAVTAIALRRTLFPGIKI